MVKTEKCSTVITSVLGYHKGIDYYINSNGDHTSTGVERSGEIRRNITTVCDTEYEQKWKYIN